jgi:polysaccharide export outer membrane protein
LDGQITLPVVGFLKLGGLPRDDAQKAIQTALGRFYTDLSVTFNIDKYSSYHIYVLGRVGSPGALQFESQPTLMQVLTRADSLPVGGSGSEKAGLVRCAIFRGNDKIVWIDLRELFSRGNLSLNIRLARNDVVYLPDAEDQLVYVLGSVQHPGAFRLSADMSFLDAFSLAGGLTEDGDSKHIALIRPQTGDQRQIAFKDLIAAKPDLNASLKEGDIIYVPERGIAKIGYLIQKTSPLSTFAILAKTLAP